VRGRRRTKRKLTWFPPLGSPFAVDDDNLRFGGVTFELQIAGSGAVVATEIPLTFDFGQEAILADNLNDPTKIPTIADLTESAWRLRRMVGKLFACYHHNNSGNLDGSTTAYPAVAFAAGFMVRNVNEFGTGNSFVDPWNGDEYSDPWLWRRSWILGQDARYLRYQGDTGNERNIWFPIQHAGPAGADEVSAFSRFPNTTAHYGSVADGGHVDAKTNRIIGPEDRLMFHIAAKGLPVQPTDPNFGVDQSKVIGMIDLRYLGHPMRGTNRRNASR